VSSAEGAAPAATKIPEHVHDSEGPVSLVPLDEKSSLATLLKLEPPAFRTVEETFLQLDYLADYVRREDLSPLEGRAVSIEPHYVDRDFMADHSVLFASTLRPPPNYCRRVHFFAGKAAAVQEELMALGPILSTKDPSTLEQYERACDEFSGRCYLGFAVIRPLPASPVGRTVLRLLPSQKPIDKSIRELLCTRTYHTHYLGATLTIHGLAFQQQDLGVSRCSTIAIWSALQKTSESEHLANATPAEITNLASKYRLPFGRPMPSEGLAVDQMCLAVQSLGVSPFLSKVTAFAQGRSLIFSATLSAMPCVLVMQKADNSELWHAVTVVGMKLKDHHEIAYIKTAQPAAGDDDSGDLKAVYVQDDRVGPYLRAEVFRSDEGQLRVRMNVHGHRENGIIQEWIVKQVLVPLHRKVRVSFNDLRSMAVGSLIPEIQRVVATEDKIAIEDLPGMPTVRFRYWIERGYEYVRRVLKEDVLSEESKTEIRTRFVMPRYVGMIRLTSERFGRIDVLVDTTSPRPNYLWLAILANRSDDDSGRLRDTIAEYIAEMASSPSFDPLAEQYRCAYFG